MKNVRKMGRVNSEKEKVLGPIWNKVLYFRKYDFSHIIHYFHSAVMMVHSDHQIIRKIHSLCSENNEYKVVDESSIKIGVFSRSF